MTNGSQNPGWLKRALLEARQGCRGVVARGLFAALVLVPGALAGRSAQACSAPNPELVKPTAIPRDGATDVPTATSFVIISASQPADVVLLSGGTAVPLSALKRIGTGQDQVARFQVGYWQVEAASGFLPASAELSLSMSDGKGGRVALSKIHTAAGYDKQQGTAATLESLTLTRIRYPVSEINSGDCVFAEYIGFASFESEPASVPGTPADSVVSTIVLSPKNGGASSQSWTFTGEKPYSGTPAGAVTSSGAWYPYLDPTLEYCATITTFGYGDVARLPLSSNVVCARVKEIASPGIATDGGATDGSGADASSDDASSQDGGSASDAGDAGAVDGGAIDATNDGDATAGTVDASSDVGVPYRDIVKDSGCSAAGTPTETLSALGTFLALCLVAGAALRPRERALSRAAKGRRS